MPNRSFILSHLVFSSTYIQFGLCFFLFSLPIWRSCCSLILSRYPFSLLYIADLAISLLFLNCHSLKFLLCFCLGPSRNRTTRFHWPMPGTCLHQQSLIVISALHPARTGSVRYSQADHVLHGCSCRSSWTTPLEHHSYTNPAPIQSTLPPTAPRRSRGQGPARRLRQTGAAIRAHGATRKK